MQDTFGLTQIWEDAALTQWFEAAQPIGLTEIERAVVEQLRHTFLKNSEMWNEIELIEYFIGPMFALIDFNTAYFKIFSERRMSAVIGEYELYGEPDALIAKGTYSPKAPFFCLNEYKRLEDARGDTLGQLLSALLVAQTETPHPRPIYGIYVIDRSWCFVVLQGKTYVISHSFAADTDAIFDIFKMLKALKVILIEIAKQDA